MPVLTEKMIKQVNFDGKIYSLETPWVMGIINVTPDSFYDGGRYVTDEAIMERAAQMIEDGADIIDVGAMSTRPDAKEIPESIEIERVAHIVRLLHAHFPSTVISVDTWRATVANATIDEGAAMINDISGGTFDPDMIPLIGKRQVPYCLMHTPAKPDVMQQCTHYQDIIADMIRFFGQQVQKLHEAHVHDIFIDPGFGFGKTLEQNYFLMNNLEAFHIFQLPLLIGVSRKSMIYKLTGGTPDNALNGTTVLNTIALLKGVSMLRVHDVKEAKEVITMVNMLCKAKPA